VSRNTQTRREKKHRGTISAGTPPQVFQNLLSLTKAASPLSPLSSTRLTDAPDSVIAMGSSLISKYGSTLQVRELLFPFEFFFLESKARGCLAATTLSISFFKLGPVDLDLSPHILSLLSPHCSRSSCL
jgi:hypothetical protein